MNKDMNKMKLLAEKYLRGEANTQEREELMAWMNDDMLLWMWFKEGIDESPSEMDAVTSQKIYERIVSQRESAPSPHRLPAWMKVAAGVAVLAIISVAAWLFLSSRGVAEPLVVKTNAGERTSVVLPDGTSVRLNAQSSLSYDCDNPHGERVVNLQGEAYFEVSHNKMPFRVVCDGLEVQCLGTKFDVKSYNDDDEATVVLKEGSVRVTSATSSVLMQPSTSVTFDRATARLTESSVIQENCISWTTGEICYDNESLENIARDLSRTFMVKVIVNSPRLKKETFTGYLGNTSLKGVLNMLTKVSDIDYKFAGDSTIYIYEKK